MPKERHLYQSICTNWPLWQWILFLPSTRLKTINCGPQTPIPLKECSKGMAKRVKVGEGGEVRSRFPHNNQNWGKRHGFRHMTMSSNGKIFRVAGYLCGEFTTQKLPDVFQLFWHYAYLSNSAQVTSSHYNLFTYNATNAFCLCTHFGILWSASAWLIITLCDFCKWSVMPRYHNGTRRPTSVVTSYPLVVDMTSALRSYGPFVIFIFFAKPVIIIRQKQPRKRKTSPVISCAAHNRSTLSTHSSALLFI